MITYLEGMLFKKTEDRVVILAHGVGYEVLLPAIVRETFNDKRAGDDGEQIKLHISHQQTERQPKPILIGFNHEAEREFFELLLTVADIGPSAAAKALTVPVPTIARAIEGRDIRALTRLNGIGERKADKIIATLHGRVGKFALMREDQLPPAGAPEVLRDQVEEVLVKQLGYKRPEAQAMVAEALKRNAGISTAEELFEEILRAQG